jgi:fumarylpyruvate hydrolase
MISSGPTVKFIPRRRRKVISNLSEYFTLAPGDLILTGTPAGVGKINPGDTLTGGVDGLGELSITLV